jgi:hypothetical protein
LVYEYPRPKTDQQADRDNATGPLLRDARIHRSRGVIKMINMTIARIITSISGIRTMGNMGHRNI